MRQNFFRKVGYGLGPNEPIPSDARKWAKEQLSSIPAITWEGLVPTMKDGFDEHLQHVIRRREIREKYADDPDLQDQKGRENYRIVDNAHEYNLQIRLHQAVVGEAPVFERLVAFWSNHFAIVEKDENQSFIVGPYQREIIRKNLTGSFENLVTDATTSWAMIVSLDNGESIPPGSKKGQQRKKQGRTPTINENHARELLELHTVSPSAQFTQDDVIQLAYIMSGWKAKWTEKRKEFNPVFFDKNYHQPGKFTVLGKTYKQRGLSSEAKLLDVLKDLSANPHTHEFLAYKLCRYFICDKPSNDMIGPIVKTWGETDGDLPSIHRTLMDVVYRYSGVESKITTPETWFAQMLRMGGTTEVSKLELRWLYEDLGHNPFMPIQPNGWPDTELEWLSPELLIRRIAYAKHISANIRKFGLERKLNVGDMLDKNFGNADEIKQWLGEFKFQRAALSQIFASKWMIYS